MNDEKKFAAILKTAKKLGFCDAQIEKISGGKFYEMEIRALRKKFKILPTVKKIDTTAAEFPAKTNYLYFSYDGAESKV